MITKSRLLLMIVVSAVLVIIYQQLGLEAPTATVSAVRRTETITEKQSKSTPQKIVSSPKKPTSSSRTTRDGNKIVVSASGNFTERLHHFIDAIDRLRSDVLSVHSERSSVTPVSSKHREIRMNNEDYLYQLNHYPFISTVVLPWKHAATATGRLRANALLHTYYPIIGTTIFCRWLRHNDKLPRLYVRIFKYMNCSHNIAEAMHPASLSYRHFKDNVGPQHKRFYQKPPKILLHIHVLTEGGYVHSSGQIKSVNTRLTVDYCFRTHDVQNITAEQLTSAPHIDEVFAMKHEPGGNYYHGMAEEIPRIAPFVDFLQRQPQIRIHLSECRHARDIMRVLGLNPSRAVHGLVRARVVYVPRAPSCMMPRLVETQLLSQRCHDYIRRNFGERPRNRIVLLRRTESRRFPKLWGIRRMVTAAAAKYGLKLTVFRDDDLPSFNSTMMMFYEAVMVIAAHGAGLSNILFCRPGTIVIEVVPNSHITPLCYMQLAHVLGLRWYGLAANDVGFYRSRFDLDRLSNTMHYYLRLWKESSRIVNAHMPRRESTLWSRAT